MKQAALLEDRSEQSCALPCAVLVVSDLARFSAFDKALVDPGSAGAPGVRGAADLQGWREWLCRRWLVGGTKGRHHRFVDFDRWPSRELVEADEGVLVPVEFPVVFPNVLDVIEDQHFAGWERPAVLRFVPHSSREDAGNQHAGSLHQVSEVLELFPEDDSTPICSPAFADMLQEGHDQGVTFPIASRAVEQHFPSEVLGLAEHQEHRLTSRQRLPYDVLHSPRQRPDSLKGSHALSPASRFAHKPFLLTNTASRITRSSSALGLGNFGSGSWAWWPSQ